ncbi:glycoside hydrolase family 19 protein [Prevotella histicola]|uniref:glycoside hydrolase family 19 protein n=1 Tax=Prevotella histicola TaxID=470565 RepID=UPI002889C9F2|nr:hypothetical protein [Prevotella histicola]
MNERMYNSFVYDISQKEEIEEKGNEKEECLCYRELREGELSQLIDKSYSRKYISALNQTFKDFGINTCIRISHFLAQVMVESSSFRYTAENGATDADYKGYKGRGLIQITLETNYRAYELYENEINKKKNKDVVCFTGMLANKQKLESIPYSVRSAGWFFAIHSSLCLYADKNDFIYITQKINGGLNGYNERLNFLKKIVAKVIHCQEREIPTNFNFKESKAYDNSAMSFAWGVWHDDFLGKKGCNYNREEAILGYERCIELNPPDTSPNINRFELKKKFPHLLVEVKSKKIYILRNKDVAKERLKQLKRSQ